MGVNFTPKAPKPSQAARIEELEAQVEKLQADNAASQQLLNTLLEAQKEADAQ